MVETPNERKNDLKEGQGEFYFLDGTHYMGEFKNGKINGKGTLFYNDKSQFNGWFP